jgi:hypothetical protein
VSLLRRSAGAAAPNESYRWPIYQVHCQSTSRHEKECTPLIQYQIDKACREQWVGLHSA